ncbi:hypothetical protein MKQ68_05710 [Chitinophaga horti]|uniref:Uncharacterized protein n=1 Tax=Chitinophaga horti TaxID=2920382 RepID=A0ABY6J8H7_9BACT|nr:hypothetical protein [Chitinophaga horti]UYQ94586.1 hypothetical protein MKQ68_05710 [Chitinophaga horti]
MEEELKNIWAAYDRKLERNLALNMRIVKEIQLQKVDAVMRPLYNIKLVGVVFGLIWLAFIAFLIRYSLTFDKIFFVISAGIHWIVSAIAVGVYIYHMSLIRSMSNSGNVMDTQRKLARLESSSLQVARVSFVQLPVFVTFQVKPAMFSEQPPVTAIIYLVITVIFTWAGLWLYRHLSYKSMDKKWFQRLVMNGQEMTPIRKASQLLRELDEFEK